MAGSSTDSLGKRLFTTRLELIGEIDKRHPPPAGGAGRNREERGPWVDPVRDIDVRFVLSDLLHAEVAGMNLDNFVVRPQRRAVERFATAEAWDALTPEAIGELARDAAGLPAEIDPEPEEAKRFDLLVLNLQLALLRSEPAFKRLRDQVMRIAGLLEEQPAIPMIREQTPLVQDLQTEEWWKDVTVPMLEGVRRRLRGLVALIEKKRRKVLYTDFVDVMGPEQHFVLPGLSAGTDFARFRLKAQAFLRAHEDHVTVHKLRNNNALTESDLSELERMLAESGVGGPEDIARAKADSKGLGLFVRSLVGLDREAGKAVLAGFLDGRKFGANQIEFANLIVDHLTEHGTMEAARLYESPFIDIAATGPESLFSETELSELVAILHDVRSRAEAA